MHTITILTDFGERDGYTAAMQGVILSLAPNVRVVTAGHDVAPQDVCGGAYALASYWNLYPVGTIHVAVIDPGVGSGRAALCVKADGRYLILPDNGLVTPVLQQAKNIDVLKIHEHIHREEGLSATFHGRDVFAYAAGSLAGERLTFDAIGTVWKSHATLMTLWPAPVDRDQQVSGEIIHIDHFGNLVTNIREQHLGHQKEWVLQAGDYSIHGISRTYSEKPENRLLMVVNSAGYLEVAARNSSAEAKTGLKKGQSISMVLSSSVDG